MKRTAQSQARSTTAYSRLLAGSWIFRGTDYDVLGGELGGEVWTLSIESFGDFLFESFNWGTGLPNAFDGSEFILWGQNAAAYDCLPEYDECGGDRWGIDLYGTVRVPEPGTLALFGIGLLGLGLARRGKI